MVPAYHRILLFVRLLIRAVRAFCRLSLDGFEVVRAGSEFKNDPSVG